MTKTTIRQALQQVADNPVMQTDDVINAHVHELVCRTLFEIANGPKVGERGSMTRANVARKMIFDRLTGRRRAGSHPATKTKIQITFANLAGELDK